MNKTQITIKEAGAIHTIILPDTTTQQVIDALVADSPSELETIRTFLTRTGAILSVETPDSSNVSSIAYDEQSGTVRFNFDNDSYSEYVSSLEKFLEDIQAPSAGKQQWKYRRGER